MVATTRHEPNDTVALWVHDLVRGAASRLTPMGATSGVPVWSPDSRRILFGATTAGQTALYLKDITSGQQEQVGTLERPNQRLPTDWSRDGRFVVYAALDPKTRSDIWYAPAPAGRIDASAAGRSSAPPLLRVKVSCRRTASGWPMRLRTASFPTSTCGRFRRDRPCGGLPRTAPATPGGGPTAGSCISRGSRTSACHSGRRPSNPPARTHFEPARRRSCSSSRRSATSSRAISGFIARRQMGSGS